MKISIIIPVYKVEKYIYDCLSSVAIQTFDGSLECIIVDDCGGDNSMVIAEDFVENYTGDIKFKIVRRQNNGGLSAARNSGLKVASGDYVTFLDSDDRLLENAISNLAKVAEKYANVDIVQADMQVSNPNGRYSYLAISPALFPDVSYDEKWCAASLLDTIPTTAWSKLIKRDFIISNNLFFKEGILHEDEMWRVMASRYIKSIAFCFTPVYYYTVDNATSITHNIDKTRNYEGYLCVAEEIISNFNYKNTAIETSHALWLLSIKRKVDIWNDIVDKSKIEDKIKSLYNKSILSACPTVIRTALFFLKLPLWLSNNKVSRSVYSKIIYKQTLGNHTIKNRTRPLTFGNKEAQTNKHQIGDNGLRIS